MEFTPDLDYRLHQMSQSSSEQLNSNAQTFATQPSYPTCSSIRDPSMGYASTIGQPSRISADPSLYNPSMNYASPVRQTRACPAGWADYNPSVNHVAASFSPSWPMYTAPRPLTDNVYQSNTQSSSTRPYITTEVGTEDCVSPGQITIRTQSSASIPSPQHNSLSSGHNIEVADVGATLAHGESQERGESGGLFKCLWEGCKYYNTFSSHASLMRHIRVQHVVHRSVKCPECDRAFGRKDNMRDHRGKRHRKFD